MAVRVILAFAILAAFSVALVAEQTAQSPKVGDDLVVRMTGDVAKEYARCTGLRTKDSNGLQIETIATIAQQFGDGRIRIELTSPATIDGRLSRLVTLTATVDSAKVQTRIRPKGIPVYRSPADQKNGVAPTLTTEATKSQHVELSELKDIKLRTWTLSEEIGDGDSK